MSLSDVEASNVLENFADVRMQPLANSDRILPAVGLSVLVSYTAVHPAAVLGAEHDYRSGKT